MSIRWNWGALPGCSNSAKQRPEVECDARMRYQAEPLDPFATETDRWLAGAVAELARKVTAGSSPVSADIVGLVPSDVGRPISVFSLPEAETSVTPWARA